MASSNPARFVLYRRIINIFIKFILSHTLFQIFYKYKLISHQIYIYICMFVWFFAFVYSSPKLTFRFSDIHSNPKLFREWSYNEIPLSRGGLVGDRVNSLVLQGSCGPSDTIPLILNPIFARPVRRVSQCTIYLPIVLCWLSGLIRRNCRTASSRDHPSGRHRGHKPVTQIIRRRTDLVPVNTSNPCFSLQLPKFVLSLRSIRNRFLWNINSVVNSSVRTF
jgi:hypothetical protein